MTAPARRRGPRCRRPRAGLGGGLDQQLGFALVELQRADVPNALLVIHVDAGMAEGWKQYEIKTDGKWTATKYKNIKNAFCLKDKIKTHNKNTIKTY